MKTIAHISDLHFGRIDPPVAEGLLADLRDNPPTLLVASGDFTQRARVGQYRAAAAYLARLPRPQLLVPGNHDIPLWNLLRRFLTPTARFQQFITPDLNPIFRTAGLIVVGVNTARSFTQQSGWISNAQLDSVKTAFATATQTDFKVLVTHHPFIPSPANPHGDIVLRAPAALARLEQFGADLLLAGHLHLAYHDDIRSFHPASRRSILSVQAGTATSDRRRGQPNAYNRITLDPDSDAITVEARSWNGKRFEPSLITRYQRTHQIWQPQVQLPLDPLAKKAPAE